MRIKEAVSSDLNTRYNEGCIHQLLSIVTYLDPRSWVNADESRGSSRSQGSWWQYWINIRGWWWKYTTKKEEPGSLTKLFGDTFNSEKSYKNPIDHAKNKLVRYKAEETLDLDDNPLKWWKDRDKLYPILSDLSCKRFSQPATSVPSERIFSCAGNVITEKRKRLLAQNVNRLIFCMKIKMHENQEI